MPKLLKLKTGVDTTTDDIVVKKAQQLSTARLINGVPFDGTQDINLDPGTSENSDKVDGYHASIDNTASTVVVRDSNKNINIDSASTTWVDFNTSTEFLGITPQAGRLYFQEEHDTLVFQTNTGDVIEIGEELLMPLAHNTSALSIPKGYLVMATGSTGDKLSVARAVTDGTIEKHFIIGVATIDAAIDSENVRVSTQGYIKGINTSAWNVGTLLYPDPNTPGWWTSTQPEAPAIRVPLAVVIKQNEASGILLIRMGHFADVSGGGASVSINTTAPTQSNNGDLWWNNDTGNLFINYEDEDSNQWVQINGQPVFTNIETSIIPKEDDAIDLGSPTKRFRDLYLTGNTLHLGNLHIKDNNGEIEFLKMHNGSLISATIKNEIEIPFSRITGMPTSLSAFGVTDAVTTNRTINGKNLSNNITLTNEDIELTSQTITNDHTLTLTNKNQVIRINSSSAITITIPTNSNVALPINTEIGLIREGTGTVSIAPASGVTLLSTDSKRKIKGQYSSAALLKTGTDTWLLIGSIEA